MLLAFLRRGFGSLILRDLSVSFVQELRAGNDRLHQGIEAIPIGRSVAPSSSRRPDRRRACSVLLESIRQQLAAEVVEVILLALLLDVGLHAAESRALDSRRGTWPTRRLAGRPGLCCASRLPVRSLPWPDRRCRSAHGIRRKPDSRDAAPARRATAHPSWLRPAAAPEPPGAAEESPRPEPAAPPNIRASPGWFADPENSASGTRPSAANRRGRTCPHRQPEPRYRH